MTPLALLSNISLLISLTVVQQLLLRRWDRTSPAYLILSGLSFGLVGVVEMMMPLHVREGLFYDSRTILLSTAGMFGGPVIGGIAAVICAIYRIMIGGVGVYVGVATIAEATLFGVVMYHLRRRFRVLDTVYALWAFGVVVHLVMLFIMLALPVSDMHYVFRNLALPLLGLYPLGNAVIGWLLIDQEARIATEHRLLESEDRYRSIFEHSHAVMLIVDPRSWRIIDANAAATAYYGYDRTELLDMTIDRINIADRDAIRARIESAWHHPVHFFATQHRLASGETCDVEVFSGPIRLEGEIFLFSIVHDVTERRRMERELIDALDRAESADRLKDLFIANISHEIRTPLNVILGYIGMLEMFVDTDASPDATNMIASVTQAGNRLIRTVDMVLTMSSLTARTYEPAFQRTDLRRLLARLSLQIEPLARAKGLIVRLHVEGEIPAVHCDIYTIEQAVSNLLDNAIKFTQEGRITLGLLVRDGHVIVSVEDTGIGISPQYMDELFTEFSQEHTGYTRPYEGIGLGLSLVKRYAEINGGMVTVSSVPGEGSRFELLVPVQQDEPPAGG